MVILNVLGTVFTVVGMIIVIKDDGCGMSPEQTSRVEDPFFTTRTTRKVGLGIPFFKMAALGTGGDFSITSRVNEGTLVQAEFVLDHIDRMPLGDISGTIYTLIHFHPDTDFCYRYRYNDRESLFWIHVRCGRFLGGFLWIHRKWQNI